MNEKIGDRYKCSDCDEEFGIVDGSFSAGFCPFCGSRELEDDQE